MRTLRADRFFNQTADLMVWTSDRLKRAAFLFLGVSNVIYDKSKKVRVHK